MRVDLAADRARVAEIEIHAAKIEARVADMEAQVLELKRLTAELRAEQTIAQQRIDSYKFPVLTRLPPEIISEIFAHLLPVYPACPPLVGTLSPISLAQICRKWRAVAQATPSLWKAISMVIPKHPNFQLHDTVNAWLRRSGSLPLSIRIVSAVAKDQAGYLSPIVPHRARWEYLKLDIDASSVLHLCDGPMPLLRHLELSLSVCHPFELRDVDLPQLRSVKLFGVLTTRAVTLPWAQLTSLMIWEVTADAMVPILHQATALVHCVLNFHWQSFRFSGPIITLPCLETLVLVGGDGIAKHILDNLSLPALLRLEFEQGTIGINHIPLLKALILTSVQLREIEITGCTARRNTIWPSEDEYRTALPSIPKFSFRYRNKLYSEY